MKKLKIKRLINKFICLAAAGIMFLCPQFTFADDSSSPSPVEIPEEDSYSSEELDFISEAFDDNDLLIRQSVVQAVRATNSSITLDNLYDLLFACITNIHGRYEWCVTDQTLYNLLNNNFSHYDSNSGNTYDSGSMLWLVLTHLNNISNEIVPALSSAPTLYSIQSQILSALNNLNAELIPASSSADTLYEITADLNDTLNAFLLAFQSFASSQINYTSALYYNNIGVAQYAYQTNQTTANVFTMLNNVLRPLISNIDTNLGNNGPIVSAVNDLNNVSFNYIENSYLGVKLDITDETYLSNGRYRSNVFYAYFTNSILTRDNVNLYRFDIPISFGSSYGYTDLYKPNFYFYNGIDLTPKRFVYYYEPNYDYISLYVIDLVYPKANNLIIKVEFDYNTIVTNTVTTAQSGVYYINSNNSDFYKVYYWISNHNYNNILNKFELIYASDDVIKAKEAQQSVEDQALADFTGSGSASAGISDVVGVKQISSTLKSGLPTQGSITNALSIFNSSNDLWGWFSQSNYDDINNPSLQTRDSIIVDFISQNENSYYNYLLEGSEK